MAIIKTGVLVHRLDRGSLVGKSKPDVALYNYDLDISKFKAMNKKLVKELLIKVVHPIIDFVDKDEQMEVVNFSLKYDKIVCSKTCAHISGEEEDIVITFVAPVKDAAFF